MANIGFKGVDIRQTGNQLVFRVSLKDSTAAILISGTTSLYLYELQSDGTLKSYDFNDNTFKTTALSTPTASMTHRTGNNSGTNTGLWTAVLSTLTGFVAGGIYLAVITNTGASPVQQEREFQYGSAEGDMTVTANGTGVGEINSDLKMANGIAVTLDTNNVLNVSVKYIGGTLQTAGDIYAYLSTNLGLLGASLSAIPKTGFKLASDGLSAISAWTVTLTGNLIGTVSTLTTYTGNTPQTADNNVLLADGTVGLTALKNLITNIKNNTFISHDIPQILERPDSGSETQPLHILFTNENGTPTDIDASGTPNVTLKQRDGTSVASRLSSWSRVSAGLYTSDYTSDSSYLVERLIGYITANINSISRAMPFEMQIVDTTAVSFTSTDRTNLGLAVSQTAAAAIRADVGLGVPNLDTQLNAVYIVAGLVQSQTDKMQFDGNSYIEANAQKFADQTPVQTAGQLWVKDGSGNDVIPVSAIADIASAVRDVSNSSPASGSLGEAARNADAKGADILAIVNDGTSGNPALLTAIETVSVDNNAIATAVDNLLTTNHGDGSWLGASNVVVSVTINKSQAQAALQLDQINILRFASLRVTFPTLGNLTTRHKLWFTAKEHKSQSDSQALIQVSEGDGLLTLNKNEASPTLASLTVTNATTGDVNLLIYSTATKLLSEFTGAYWDVKMGTSEDDCVVLAEGQLDISNSITQSV